MDKLFKRGLFLRAEAPDNTKTAITLENGVVLIMANKIDTEFYEYWEVRDEQTPTQKARQATDTNVGTKRTARLIDLI